MDTRSSLLQQLADGRFQSGERLARQLGVSRAAVWKQLQAIRREFGLQVDAVRGRGYRLAEPIELLDSERIVAQMPAPARASLQAVHLHHSIDSTNSWLMERVSPAARSGTVCLAEQQCAGRGRHGRQWVSPFGRNVYLSLLWCFDMAPAQVAGMSLAAGIAVVRSLRELGCDEAGLKWPNDILWRDRKLAGLLLEVAGEANGPSQVVIGVGLNTRLGGAGDAIDQPWVDLASIPGVRSHSRNALVASLLKHLLEVAESYERGGLAAFLEEWQRYDLLRGAEVVVRSASQAYQGRHLGVNESGAIQLEIDGEVRAFFAGEVSLRRLPGA